MAWQAWQTRNIPQVPLLQRGYPRGASTCTVTKPSQASPKRAEDRPVQAQDLAAFKFDMIALIKDMIQNSLSPFASQSKSDFGGKGESSQDQQISRDKEPSKYHIHVDLSEFLCKDIIAL